MSKLCGVCEIKTWLYTCPSCNIHFCSVCCCEDHKISSGCNGIRSTTKFVPLKEFNTLQLKSDYYYLESTREKAQDFNRQITRRKIYQLDTPDHVHFIQKRALCHGVLLRIFSEGMSKRRNNTTAYVNAIDEIQWKVEFILFYLHSNGKDDNNQIEVEKVIFDKIGERRILKDILHEKFSQFAISGDDVGSGNDVDSSSLFSIHQCLIKMENISSSDNLYLQLDYNQTLRKNLENIEIFEYPTIYILLDNNKNTNNNNNNNISIKESLEQKSIVEVTYPGRNVEKVDLQGKTQMVGKFLILTDQKEIHNWKQRNRQQISPLIKSLPKSFGQQRHHPYQRYHGDYQQYKRATDYEMKEVETTHMMNNGDYDDFDLTSRNSHKTEDAL